MVVVPKESTYEQQGSYYVYRIADDSMAVSTRIAVLADVENLYVLSDGLKKGDRIVAKGVAQLKGDTKVKPMEIPFDSIAKPVEKVFR